MAWLIFPVHTLSVCRACVCFLHTPSPLPCPLACPVYFAGSPLWLDVGLGWCELERGSRSGLVRGLVRMGHLCSQILHLLYSSLLVCVSLVYRTSVAFYCVTLVYDGLGKRKEGRKERKEGKEERKVRSGR